MLKITSAHGWHVNNVNRTGDGIVLWLALYLRHRFVRQNVDRPTSPDPTVVPTSRLPSTIGSIINLERFFPGCPRRLRRPRFQLRFDRSVTQTRLAMYRRRYRTTLGLGLGSSLSSTFSTTLSIRTTTTTRSVDSVRSDARATAAKLKSKYENAGTAQGTMFFNLFIY